MIPSSYSANSGSRIPLRYKVYSENERLDGRNMTLTYASLHCCATTVLGGEGNLDDREVAWLM